jgi:hypothetical protein
VWLNVPVEGRKRAPPRGVSAAPEGSRVGAGRLYSRSAETGALARSKTTAGKTGAGTADGEGQPSHVAQNRGADSGGDQRGAHAEDQGCSLPRRRCPNGVDGPTRLPYRAREDGSTLSGDRGRPILHHPRRRGGGPGGRHGRHQLDQNSRRSGFQPKEWSFTVIRLRPQRRNGRERLFARRTGLTPGPGPPPSVLALIHPSAWKVDSRISAYSVVHITPPQSPKARSSTQPHLMIDSYILWCWIDIRDRECFSATGETAIGARISPAMSPA